MKVKAIKTGFYNYQRQKEGAVFILKKENDFSPKWMKALCPQAKKAESKKLKKMSEKELAMLEQERKREEESPKEDPAENEGEQKRKLDESVI